MVGINHHTASRAWYQGWPSVNIPPISKLFYEKTGKAPPVRKEGEPVIPLGAETFNGAATEFARDPSPEAPHTSTDTILPPTTGEAQPAAPAPEVRIVVLDQREIDRRVAAAVGVVKRDIAQALERENQMLKVVRSNAVGLAVSVERILVALQPLLDNMPEQIAMEVASGKMTSLKTLEMLQRLAKAASTVTYVAGAAMQHQRLLAGMPQQITESRTGEADKPSDDIAEDMTNKLLTTLARAQHAAHGGDDEEGYSGEESGRPDDAIDVDSELVPKP